MNTATTKQHLDGPIWAGTTDIICELAHIDENGGYIFLSDDLQLWEAQTTIEYDHALLEHVLRDHHRFCS